ncbi:MAG: hypothetical protein ACLQRH_20350 [Acidimicrobiales bacterium]|jgi:hypothetical protein
MTESSWNEITITNRKTFKEIGDRVEVEWELSTRPRLEWAEIFQMASISDRKGPREWVMGGGPDVIGSVVRWFVPISQIENADAEVLHRASVANERFESLLSLPDAKAPNESPPVVPDETGAE